MRLQSGSLAIATSVAAVLSSPLCAQWATFQDQTSTRLVAAPGLGATDPQEKDYAWADFDQDGDIDLVCVRKQPATTPGKYPNVLFMNENGVLTDRTSTLASASLVPGSQGMLDATNDRDVVVADVNGDGWLDLVTCTTLTAGDPQYIRVPRVYINRGDDALGNWQGFLYDDPLRISDTQPGAANWNGEHRFCSVAAGDIDNDGDIDLYFGDYQQGGSRSLDVNDRLLINNGLGYFTDETAARMTFQMVESSFAMKVAMVDMNADGKLDILKDDALNAPQGISVSYNNGPTASPQVPGYFGDYQTIYGNAPYHFHVADLNNDNRPDMIVSDDGQDRYILHTGNDANGLATFGPTIAFTYTGGGSDDGFGGNNIVADLNNDGWKDVIIADFDVDIAGCSRRTHIFRNLGNAPNVTLQEEMIAGNVVGIPTGMLTGTFDVAVFDINGDGWNDMVIGRCNGTTVWINQPPTGMSFTFPGGLPSMISPGGLRTLNVNATGIGGVTAIPGSGLLHYSINGGPWLAMPMTDIGPGQYRVTLPVMPNCADGMRYFVTVDGVGTQGQVTFSDPPTAPAAFHSATSAITTNVVFEDNFESGNLGWTVTNTALTAGAWEIAVPNGTVNNGQVAAPYEDGEASTSSTRCFVTMNGVFGGQPGAADVDGGPTDLISPPLNFAGSDGFISYRRHFYCAVNNSDALNVAVSSNGVNWVTVENVVAPGQNQWITRQFRVSDFVTPSATVRVRFRVSDNPNDSITEAAIDVFRAEAFACTVCQPSVGLQGPGTATFSMCGGDLSSGTSALMLVQGTPPNAWGIMFFGNLNPVPFFGGLLIDPQPLIQAPITTDATGQFGFVFPGGFGNVVVYVQVGYLDASLPLGVGMTNALQVTFKP